MIITEKQMEIIENLGWNVEEDKNGYIEFRQYSPAGEDFGFGVRAKNNAEFINEVREYALYFDADEHIEMWIEAKKNGVEGIPSVRELVKDADDIAEMLEDLAIALANT